MKKIYLLLLVLAFAAGTAFAGNPDRQGEAGAAQLLMNPWAPSAGLHSLNTANVFGVESMRINPAGLSRMTGTNIMLGYANYLQGTGISMQAIGVGSANGKGGAIGLSLHSLDFGDVPVTTTNQPEGTGALLSLSFINIGLTYSHTFEEAVSVGVTLRGVSEGTSDVSAFGIAIDAGVQYITGENDEFKFGLSLRNVGSRMAYGGQGLATFAPNPDPSTDYELLFSQRAAGFEMPSMLNIGVAYDFLSGIENQRVTLVANFTANSFSRDQVGAGLEYAFREQFIARVGYRTDLETDVLTEVPLYDGLSAGASIRVPVVRGQRDKFFSIDYAWRNTRIFNGTHNIGLSVAI
ncbi:PorV/PorQ family protein [Neolewinella lacunae]|uniref:PorV/PorQ family protein n=1 Tax=Neolewinella lacunae TaxID=1517758 RepID=A0A923PJK9_9BACT|nr:PorV/PorQ family protein [Neolewinella lacunae]MBC6995267.1 PorV/PorQ family protein [Neolewinella lacunae]MDN3635564.1 PorV/PorQ family protein [Neolewinella lacunae]